MTSPLKKNWRFKIISLIILVAVAGVVYLYFWYLQTNKLRQEAQVVIEKAEKYETINENIKNEYFRCQEFITQKEGDFASFEYCKRFIQWVNQISPQE